MPHEFTASPVQFKIIDGFPDHRVGDDGSVWSRVKRGSHGGRETAWRRLNGHLAHCGHIYVSLGRCGSFLAHRLVLQAFRGPCPEGQECLHIDGDPGNNRLSNLRWGTPKENGEDMVRHGVSPRGERHGLAKLTEGMVRAIMAERDRSGAGARSIAALLGLPAAMRGAVGGVIRGQTWNHVTGLPPYKPRSNKPG